MKVFQKITFLITAQLLLIGLAQLYYSYSGGFSCSDLMPSNKEICFSEARPPLVEEILKQPYTFLGQGRQTYAFVSSDGKYVLKLFKNRFISRSWLSYIIAPLGPLKKLFLHDSKGESYRRSRLLCGYETAYAKEREASALLYYTSAGAKVPLKAKLYSPLGEAFTLDLSCYTFALQYKVTPTSKELLSLIAAGAKEEATKRLLALRALYMSEYRRGLYDRDYNIVENTGFICGRAVRQDVGRLVVDDMMKFPEAADANFKKVFDNRLKPWLKRRFPLDYQDLIDSLEAGQ